MSLAANRELCSAPEFFALVRTAVRFRSHALTLDPLGTAVGQVTLNPHFAQSRLLMRILSALPSMTGEFRRAEVSALDSATLALVVDLIDLHLGSTRSGLEWAHAIEEARRASP